MKRIIFLIAGILFTAAGIVGLILPLFPQIPFLVLGFMFLMLGSERFSVWFRSKAIYRNKIKPYIQKHKYLSRLMKENSFDPDPEQEQTDILK